MLITHKRISKKIRLVKVETASKHYNRTTSLMEPSLTDLSFLTCTDGVSE